MKITTTVTLISVVAAVTALALVPGASEGARYFAGAVATAIALLTLIAP